MFSLIIYGNLHQLHTVQAHCCLWQQMWMELSLLLVVAAAVKLMLSTKEKWLFNTFTMYRVLTTKVSMLLLKEPILLFLGSWRGKLVTNSPNELPCLGHQTSCIFLHTLSPSGTAQALWGGTMRVHCVICGELSLQTQDVSAAPCGHTFHTLCILQWLERWVCCDLPQEYREDKNRRVNTSFKTSAEL